MNEFEESKVRFAKLNNTNYQPWKFKIRMLLIREGVWKIVQEKKSSSVTEEWIKKDEIAQATISLSVEDDQIIHICKCETSNEMWTQLQGVHERSNLSNKLYLLRKLYQAKLTSEMSMNDYIRSTLEMVESLRGIGEEIKNFHVAALLLSGLPEEYDTLVTALDARPEEDLTLEYVKGKLVDEYKRKKSYEVPNGESALKIKTPYPRKPNIFKPCDLCGRRNHLTKDCYSLKNKFNKENKEYIKPKYNNNYKMHKAKTVMCNDRSKETCFVNNSVKTKEWILDSGATSHMTSDKTFFTNLTEKTFENITVANGQEMKCLGIGEGFIELQTGKRIRVVDVLYVPELESNLLSVKRLTEKGNKLIFKKDRCTIYNAENEFITIAVLKDLYRIQMKEEKVNFTTSCNSENCIHSWHKRLGHRNPETIKEYVKENKNIKLVDCGHLLKCTSCIEGKLSSMPYPKETNIKSRNTLDLLHSDICGPMKTLTPGKNKYFLTITDDFSRYTEIYLLKNKYEVPEKIEDYIKMAFTKHGRYPKIFRSDNAGEYTGRKTQNILKNYGIKFETSTPYCPQQNGVAERKNRTLCESARTMLLHAKLPSIYWGEAIVTANYLINRLPSRSIKNTPYQLWHGKSPGINHLKVFGCEASAFVPKERRTKWEPKAIKGIFVGYSDRSKAYRILLPENNEIIISRTVKFNENIFINDLNKNNNDQEKIIENENDNIISLINNNNNNENKDEMKPKEMTLRRSTRSTKGIPPDRLTYATFENTEFETREPESWTEMMNLDEQNRQNWIDAANEEINSLKEKRTWILTELPEGKKSIGSKWVFKRKLDSNGKVIRHKARLVAKGYNQKYGRDYDATFAPVMKQSTLRILLSVAAKNNLIIKHFDVKTAFLNGNVSEDIYMTQPEGFVDQDNKHLVCKLIKSLYGLKQAARAWNEKLDETLKILKFKQSSADSCLYFKDEGSGPMYLLVYVDDILCCHSSEETITNLEKELNKHFEIKDLGQVNTYLGINIQRTEDGSFYLNQENKIDKIINELNLENANGVNIPMEPDYLKHSEEINLLDNNDRYAQAVGALLYISTTTRPDIAAAVGFLCRRVSKPRKLDWEALKRLVKYLKKTKKYKLKISSETDLKLKGYVDADWGGDATDRKSTSGYIFFLGQNPIFWASQKQTSVSLSSSEAEYISASTASQELLWLRRLLPELGISCTEPTTVYEDNQACIRLASDEKSVSRTKHIDIKYHQIRDLIAKKIMSLEYCCGQEMVADIFTKALPRPRLEALLPHIGLTAP